MIGSLLTPLSVVAGVILTLVFVFVLLRSRRTPQSIMAWLLFLVAAPYLALPVFLIVGIRKAGSSTKPPQFNTEMPDTAVRPEAQPFRGYGLPTPTAGHHFTLHETPEAARSDLFALIEEARERLDFCFYLLDNDANGNAVIEAMTERQLAGITVRLALDRFGTLNPPKAALRRFQDAGGRLRYYSPLLRKPFTERINLRNHRKVAIADGRTVWSGGAIWGMPIFPPLAAAIGQSGAI
ncbi:phospholipase D-like domain-containing protein [Aquicoccus sp. G2-2]|uniref:phospholipase D-like domain-containing protein n=1 Tax=Aquicoccus sp. G2-2 TaxID=3092120 RepID=UPI002AE00556|nr:phospholipase D-like domain-containing protein [Aquicoccus sp. G2-2]MEA1114864.1 phospholipase D-like domain-containing protein [Aquicoccus sp. G2-2]